MANSASRLCWLGGGCPAEILAIEVCDPDDRVPDKIGEADELGVCTGDGDAAPEPKRRRVEEKRREGSRRVEAN